MIAVFDIGGVLIDWDPRYLFRKLIADETELEYFLTHVCSHTWNLLQHAGRPFAQGVAELSARYPQYADHVAAYHQRWEEMLGGPIEGSVALLQELEARGVPLYAITNFNPETFSRCRELNRFLDAFTGIVVSGEVKLVKPDPAIYLTLLRDYRLDAAQCVFIDDAEINVRGAERVGMHAIHYRNPTRLRQALIRFKLL